jgi:hypothetical protein
MAGRERLEHPMSACPVTGDDETDRKGALSEEL